MNVAEIGSETKETTFRTDKKMKKIVFLSVVDITATAAAGYNFVNWTGTVAGKTHYGNQNHNLQWKGGGEKGEE